MELTFLRRTQVGSVIYEKGAVSSSISDQDAIFSINNGNAMQTGHSAESSSGSGGVTKRTITGALDGSNMTYTISGAAANVDSTLVNVNQGIREVTLAGGGGDFTLDATGLIYTNNGTALTDVAHGGTDSLIIYA
jgi:hypothetical protein